MISLCRLDDVVKRGAEHKVYNYNGTIVALKNAIVWYKNDGTYVEPRSVDKKVEDKCDFCIMC